MRCPSASLRRLAIFAVLCCAAAVPLGAMAVDTRPRGLVVDNVDAGGPAEKAGIAVNDVITAVEGAPLESARDIVLALAHHKPGDQMVLTIEKGKTGAPADVTLTLGANPDDAARPWMGLSVLVLFLVVPEGQPQAPQPPAYST
ncbi:MAG TPA: PDZ domain-containing protein [Spirochaetia bacterium]